MTDNQPEPEPQPEPTELFIERRTASEVALVATPFAIVLQPIVGALADKYIGPGEQSDSPPQEPQPPAEPAE